MNTMLADALEKKLDDLRDTVTRSGLSLKDGGYDFEQCGEILVEALNALEVLWDSTEGGHRGDPEDQVRLVKLVADTGHRLRELALAKGLVAHSTDENLVWPGPLWQLAENAIWHARDILDLADADVGIPTEVV